MDVLVNGWAWLPKAELTASQLVALKKTLTIEPRRTSVEQKTEPEPIPLWTETATHIGIAREYFFQNRRPHHTVEWGVTEGSTDWHPAKFEGQLRPEQQTAMTEVLKRFHAGQLGGIIQAKPGWGKTVTALAIAAKLKVPTLVVVHKKFLMDQWIERIQGNPEEGRQAFLPDARVGRVQQYECDFRG